MSPLQKAYFTLGEIAERWGCDQALILQNAMEGRLTICAQIDPRLIDLSQVVHVDEPRQPIHEGLGPDLPLIELRSDHVAQIVTTGQVWAGGMFVFCVEGKTCVAPLREQYSHDSYGVIRDHDLYLTREERDRFEEAQKISIVNGDPLQRIAALEAQIAEIQNRAKARWPWGDHETELLQVLAQAAKKFWSRYDPQDKSTAVTNEQVTDWIRSQKAGGKPVSNRVALGIATILRADDLPPGRRRK